jgi:matrixin/carboxypeptidase family protein
MRIRTAALAALLGTIVGSGLSDPLLAYLKIGSRVQNRTISLRWRDFPIRYYVTDTGTADVSATQFQGAVTRAFNTWNAVETATTSSQFAGFTQARPLNDDGMVVIGYVNRADLERTLALTNFLVDVTNGEIVESDILFNMAFPWSTSANGDSGRFDVESIALHEIGHLHGLGHSALGETEVRPGGRRVLGAEAVMFPIAFTAGSTADRTLRADDIAGISDIYSSSNAASRRLGSISGKVTKNGTGVVGAHIIAFNPSTGVLVGGFTLADDGSFTIARLEPGTYVLRVEPLDDGDIESFFDPSTNVDLNFRVRFHDRVVAVPESGGTTGIEIKVDPK